jgi:hypothetical protein
MPFRRGALFRISPALVAVIAVVIAAFPAFVIAGLVGAHHRRASTGREKMLISVLPKTSLGKWSLGLAIAFILFVVLIGVLPSFSPFDPAFNAVQALILKIILAAMPGAVLLVV